ncbi:unnamed protein product [Menidia menidia]|uniref:(Atlantic silverside) hypothetical protein n=1 Tax=Menidia menidia TaxID=238744 RepID=A0A8S4B960_9TELE|nr:unnamed protein product [Menidia menidia]
MEIADNFDQLESQQDEDSSFSDNSVSLLRDLPSRENIGDVEEFITTDSHSKAGDTEMKNEMEMKINQLQLAANFNGHFKIPSQKMLHKRNEKGESLLHKACQRKDLVQVRALIQAGISVNVEDNAGWTALHEACIAGNEAVVEELLKAGAHVDARSSEGVTPLHDAVVSEHYQNGCDPSDRNVGGETALDMAEGDIKELLLAFQASAATQDKSQKAVKQSRPAGTISTDGGQAQELPDSQLRKENTLTNKVSHLSAITTVLTEVRRKQAEMTTWPLTNLEDKGRYRAALTHIQSVLIDVLHKQQLEKKSLVKRFKRVPVAFREHVLKSQVLSLLSCQKNLMEILQKQVHLEEVCVPWKDRSLPQPSNKRCSVVPRQQPDLWSSLVSAPASYKPGEKRRHRQDGKKNRSNPVTQPRLLRSLLTCPDLQNNKTSSCLSAPQPEKTVQQASFNMKDSDLLIQKRGEEDSRYLHRLVRGGIVAPGSALQLLLKGKQHIGHVHADGSIMTKGKQHQSPESWLKSILGKNIPVSSAYAMDKITVGDKPLSYYKMSLEAKENPSQILFEDSVCFTRGDADASHEELIPDALDPNNLLKRIKIVHLVNDDELLPSAIIEHYWDKLLKQDPSEFDDWNSEL